MRGLIEEMQGAISWFAQEQREHFAMVLAYEDPDAVMVQSTLNGLDQGDPATLFLSFAHEARTERAYADVMAELMRTRREGVNAERAERGRPLVPDVPRECLDAAHPASSRIRRLIEWWRGSLLQADQPMVVALLPMKLPDPELYERIVWDLLPAGSLAPWTRNTRLVLRDTREQPRLLPRLHREPREATVTYTIDFSAKACEEGLAADAANRGLSPMARATAMLQLAALDFAHQRLPQALDKYGRLGNVFQGLGETSMVALCLCGAGDVHHRAGQWLEARKRYAQGAKTATQAESKPVLLNCLIGLGKSCFELGQFDQSEAAWDAAARVAGSMGNPYGVADAVEQVGVARLEQRRAPEALQVWERTLELIDEHPYSHREVSVLERMAELAKQQGWREREDRYRRRLVIAKANAEQQVTS